MNLGNPSNDGFPLTNAPQHVRVKVRLMTDVKQKLYKLKITNRFKHPSKRKLMSELYQTLNSNLQTSDLKRAEKEEILQTVDAMDADSMDAMFKLIYEHGKQNEVPDDIPYGEEVEDGVLEFNLGKMPISLRRILFKFVKIVNR